MAQNVPLSLDILREIFAHAVIRGMTVDDKEDRVSLRRKLPLVCKTWRDVVETTPILWTLIYVSFAHGRPSRKYLDLCIARSGALELDITIRWDGCYPEDEAAALTVAMQALMPHIERWKLIHVDLGSVYAIEACASTWHGRAQVLEELFFCAPQDGMDMPDDDDDENSFGKLTFGRTFSAPKLRTYVLYDIPLSAGATLYKRFPALDELSLVHACFDIAPANDWPKLVAMLKGFKHLRSLNLVIDPEVQDDDDDGDEDDEDDGSDEDADNDENDERDHDTPTLLALEELKVRDITQTQLAKLLSTLRAPRLAQLEITNFENNDDDARLAQIRRQLKHFSSLRTLVLYDSAETIGTENVLKCFAGLERYELIHVKLDPFLRLLAGTERHWGRVKSLELHAKEAVPLDALRELVSARRAAAGSSGVPAIEGVTVHTMLTIKKEDRSWFENNLRRFVWTGVTDVYAAIGLGSVTLVCEGRA